MTSTSSLALNFNSNKNNNINNSNAQSNNKSNINLAISSNTNTSTTNAVNDFLQKSIILSQSSSSSSKEFILIISLDTKLYTSTELIVDLIQKYDSNLTLVSIYDISAIQKNKHNYPWFTGSLLSTDLNTLPILLEIKTNKTYSNYSSIIKLLEEYFISLQEIGENSVNIRNRQLISEYNKNGSHVNIYQSGILKDLSQLMQMQAKMQIQMTAMMTQIATKLNVLENKIENKISHVESLLKNIVNTIHIINNQQPLALNSNNSLPSRTSSTSSVTNNANNYSQNQNKQINFNDGGNDNKRLMSSSSESKKIHTMYSVEDFKQASAKDIEDRVKEYEAIERYNRQIEKVPNLNSKLNRGYSINSINNNNNSSQSQTSAFNHNNTHINQHNNHPQRLQFNNSNSNVRNNYVGLQSENEKDDNNNHNNNNKDEIDDDNNENDINSGFSNRRFVRKAI
jgi:hypothetical protein